MLPAIAQLMAAAASCSPVARLLGTRRRQQEKASSTFRISPDLQGSKAMSICADKALENSAPLEEQKAREHCILFSETHERKQLLQDFRCQTSQ